MSGVSGGLIGPDPGAGLMAEALQGQGGGSAHDQRADHVLLSRLQAGRVHPADPEQETERFGAAERLADLIEQREELAGLVASIEAEMAELVAVIRA